jgi:hypothetical protein
MKHANKDGTLSAESAEGRRRLKENALSPDTYPTQSGTARVPRVGECADGQCLAASYPREEPDAPVRICVGAPGTPVSLPRSPDVTGKGLMGDLFGRTLPETNCDGDRTCAFVLMQLDLGTHLPS